MMMYISIRSWGPLRPRFFEFMGVVGGALFALSEGSPWPSL